MKRRNWNSHWAEKEYSCTKPLVLRNPSIIYHSLTLPGAVSVTYRVLRISGICSYINTTVKRH